MKTWLVWMQEAEGGYRYSTKLEGGDEDDVIRRAVSDATVTRDVFVWTLDITDRPGRLVRVKRSLELLS